MSFLFPEKPEVQLGKAPLAEVICQVRFPAILRIANEQPAAFQEEIRTHFPLLETEQSLKVQVAGPGSSNAPAADFSPRLHRFLSTDKASAVSLTVDFYALSSKQYNHWQDFAACLQLATDAMQEIYSPAYATRIGLRYINQLTAENTGASNREALLNLLNPSLTAVTDDAVGNSAMAVNSQLLFTDQQKQLRLRIGFEEVDDGPLLTLDLDHYETGSLPLEGVLECCEGYHDTIYNAFRWALKDRALTCFAPIVQEKE